MKFSKYNVTFSRNGSYYVFNQLSSALREIDEEMYQAIQNHCLDINKLDWETEQDLTEYQFICDEDLEEENLVLQANKTHRFCNPIIRLTIMPTLDCNFRCWYCYENHVPGWMDESSINAVVSFCNDLMKSSGAKNFILDWFGGEPMMYFHEIVYPVSLAIKRLCEEFGLKFTNIVTTNAAFIDDEMVSRMAEIDLSGFQITLDGSKRFHDKVRFHKDRSGSYDQVVSAITSICNSLENIDMSVRINYTPANISTIHEIAESFPKDIRHKIRIEPQLVWQFKDSINSVSDVVKDKLDVFQQAGYQIDRVAIPSMQVGCYAENMKQYVINYDLQVFKCTARDFSSGKHSIGKIDSDGNFIPSPYYFKYFTKSSFENDNCLACELLPSCGSSCIQKQIEGQCDKCVKDIIRDSILNRLALVIDEQIVQ